MKIVQVQQQFT